MRRCNLASSERSAWLMPICHAGSNLCRTRLPARLHKPPVLLHQHLTDHWPRASRAGQGWQALACCPAGWLRHILSCAGHPSFLLRMPGEPAAACWPTLSAGFAAICRAQRAELPSELWLEIFSLLDPPTPERDNWTGVFQDPRPKLRTAVRLASVCTVWKSAAMQACSCPWQELQPCLDTETKPIMS